MTIEDFRPTQKITTFYPPQRVLMGPGPSDTHSRVLSAMARPTLGHLDPVFTAMMEELKSLLRYAFQTKNLMTFPVSGPGSVGMEMCFVNMIVPGDKVIVCRNGVFGSRMIENVERHGGVAVVVDDKWGEPVDPQKVEDALKQNPDAKILAFVHAETSTGVLSDAKTLCELAHRHGCLNIVDTVTSLGGSPLKVDEWGIDAIYSGSQKCLSCPPGLSPVSFSERVIELVKNRKEKVHSWFMDLNLLLGYWGTTRTYHHTAPTNALYALHESLFMLYEEGLEHSWARHDRNYKALKAGLETFGMKYVVDERYRLPQLNAVYVPEGVDEKEVRRRLLDEYNLEIGAGLGDFAGKIWRFGLMGYSSKIENIVLCLNALETVFSDMGMKLEHGAAESAAHHSYAANPMPSKFSE
ncbi:alanine-glyoxylate aminotransferase apoenzyme [Nitrosomonas cryotolerans]|uniref:Alanine-glyoxylate aminotransferase apoenzyme n=1 Tax=Nitrosomonas cryotolerans ATCC 49181 TaxID=1131553 RepID=A0A1N6I6W9_9PROT|nr:alanine--glyoxylate aminotransferase family protein [Nitrosomonas cryotolerans]SFQ15549.1 alanine-glyoxylate aminotransferase apoenzyme [Nitrosomonas cryotolerans]SIO27788.1 alanine-glyoxylate aminotransferase apoenzyme [Nitrosomonas cryotolerans ATCC 49181]